MIRIFSVHLVICPFESDLTAKGVAWAELEDVAADIAPVAAEVGVANAAGSVDAARDGANGAGLGGSEATGALPTV